REEVTLIRSKGRLRNSFQIVQMKGLKPNTLTLVGARLRESAKPYRDQCLAQTSSERLPPAADGNKYRDAQPDNVQSMRDLGTLSPTRCLDMHEIPWRSERVLDPLEMTAVML
ncbi:hypothetical protein STEG23_009419, partial [Scotinomys teguina]